VFRFLHDSLLHDNRRLSRGARPHRGARLGCRRHTRRNGLVYFQVDHLRDLPRAVLPLDVMLQAKGRGFGTRVGTRRLHLKVLVIENYVDGNL
jgi:hypothetical protein